MLIIVSMVIGVLAAMLPYMLFFVILKNIQNFTKKKFIFAILTKLMMCAVLLAMGFSLYGEQALVIIISFIMAILSIMVINLCKLASNKKQ